MQAKYLAYSKAELAKMEAGALAKEVDKFVRGVFNAANRSVDDADAKAVQKRDEARKTLQDYIDEQRAMFKAKNILPDRAWKEAIIPVGSFTNSRGKIVEMMRIVPRGVDLTPVEKDDKLVVGSVTACATDSSRLGLARDQRRGKYNDAGLLVEQSAASVDRSEVVPFRSNF